MRKMRGYDGATVVPGRCKKGRLCGGLHIAPFLSPSGGVVMISLDHELLMGIAEVTAAAPAPLSGWGADARSYFPRDGANASVFSLVRDDCLLPAGVHNAPWPDECYWSTTLLAIDSRHRLVAQMTAETDDEIPEVFAILRGVLDAHEAPAKVAA